MRWMNTSSSAGGISRQTRSGARTPGRDRAARGPAGSVPLTCRVVAERRHHLDAGPSAQARRPAASSPGPSACQVTRSDAAITSSTVPCGQQPAVGDVGDAVAALGLVHVVGADQHGHAVGGQPVDLVPELAPRLGVDAGGGLVEQQQLRLVDQAGGERQPLLPAARERAGQLVAAVGEAQPLQRLGYPLARAGPWRRARATKSRFSRMLRSS